MLRKDRRRMLANDPITPRQVAVARHALRAKIPLATIAADLRVRSSDLDIALWRYIDTDVDELIAHPRRVEPMF